MKVPVVGTEKKSTVMLFAAAGVGVIIYAMMAKKKAAAAAAAAAAPGAGAGTFTDPAGSVCSAPNPATGYCPGTPADISAQQQLAAGSSAYGVSGGSQYGGGYLGSVSSLGGQSLSNAVPVFTNNGAWGQYVEQMLGSNGSDAIAAAIAKYLSGQSLTTDQATVAEEAVAIANYPPVSGPGGFPPSMNTTATSSTTPGTCSAGHTWVQTATGAAGETAATGGAGWCLPPAAGGTGGTGGTMKHYRCPGGKSLSQIAKQLGTSPESIVSATSGTDYNHGKAWPYLDNWSAPIPAGIILSYNATLT